MRSLRLLTAAFAAAPLLWLAACAKNPVGPSPTSGALNNGASYQGYTEALSSNVIFSPTAASQLTGLWGGSIQYSWGGNSTVLLSTGPGYQPPAAGSPNTNIILRGPASYRGIGGRYGDFSNDYYLHWEGYKGPSASTDYNSLVINLKSGSYVPVDLTQYRGLVFFARGNANFGVQFAGLGVKTGQTGPYTDYNYYEYVFGGEINSSTWKQITINFSDLTQLYGAAVDKTLALQATYALQFIQETPYVSNFELDLDYLTFF